MVANKGKIIEFANNNGLAFDNVHSTAYGSFRGYEISIIRIPNGSNFLISMNLGDMNGIVTQDSLKNMSAEVAKLSSVTVRSNGATVFETASSLKEKTCFDNLQTCLEGVVEYLLARGITNYCYACKSPKPTQTYVFNSTALNICDTCKEPFEQSLMSKISEHSAKPENIPLGIMGAVLGSLIGVAAIVIIGQLGYVAAISGFLLAIFTFKGYEKFSGKMGKVGLAICVVIMIAMVFVGNHLDWAVFLMREFEVGLIDAVIAVTQVAEMELYNQNLMMIAIFAIVGSFGSIRATLKTQTTKLELKKLQ